MLSLYYAFFRYDFFRNEKGVLFPLSILNFQFSTPLSFSQHHYRPRTYKARMSHGLAQNDVTIYVVRK